MNREISILLRRWKKRWRGGSGSDGGRGDGAASSSLESVRGNFLPARRLERGRYELAGGRWWRKSSSLDQRRLVGTRAVVGFLGCWVVGDFFS